MCTIWSGLKHSLVDQHPHTQKERESYGCYCCHCSKTTHETHVKALKKPRPIDQRHMTR